jgi:EAL domain-containing protein (putative c-di-GMP-specific phosphodiesterase class I)/DNA-binding NarL/FixJ family response regulator
VRAVTVLIAEDDRLVADALLELLSVEPAIDVVGVARHGDEAIALAEELSPRVALVDVRMPGGGGARVARALDVLVPPTRVIAYSAFDDRDGVIEMLRAGAVAYVVKGGPIDDIARAVHRAARGLYTLSPAAAEHVAGELAAHLDREREASASRSASRARIEDAIARDAIDVEFQPIWDLRADRIVGHEALARFTATPGVSPDRWFAEAEHVDMGVQLETAALRAATAAVAAAGDRIEPGTFVSLNASPATIVSDGFAAAVAAVEPQELVVEVTEHAAIADYTAFAAALRGLRGAGARLAVDDVGAGYATMRHIVALGPDVIKLDQALTRGVDADPSRRALAVALVWFASEIGAAVVAEGLETEDEVATMRQLGAHYGQGYVLGRPAVLTASGAA